MLPEVSSAAIAVYLQSFEARILEVGAQLRHAMITQAPHLIRERIVHKVPYADCMIGSEMVDWLLDLSVSIGAHSPALSRFQEEVPSREDLASAVFFLSTVGPDALFRMILKKLPQDRTPEELELVYEELLHVKALSHLSTMVKRELATVIGYEHHTHAGTVLFHQGDPGKNWYIILRGSVDVSIHGKVQDILDNSEFFFSSTILLSAIIQF
ncbi:hypothetical protein NECAME_09246 [Necator americanus]|uniref:Cyclic nucleotide-binding domain-containing protein n=1 Tax=Necator americanus TaxID=51031 RepID=W2TH76_NECAM|nr:hypothetical protein NECAME_09246 [Necator americanus]ETN80352.1 hypothetical protein NECAME_09246 [Necator americanus]